MRKFRSGNRQFGGSFAAGAVNANTVNITQVTHVTQIVRNGCSNGGRAHRPIRHDGRACGRVERPSKLFAYMAQGRSAGELCDESVRTLGIAARGFCTHAESFASGACGIVKGAVGIVASLFGK